MKKIKNVYVEILKRNKNANNHKKDNPFICVPFYNIQIWIWLFLIIVVLPWTGVYIMVDAYYRINRRLSELEFGEIIIIALVVALFLIYVSFVIWKIKKEIHKLRMFRVKKGNRKND